MNIKAFAVILIFGLVLAGCSTDSTMPMNPPLTPSFTLNPGDGAANVRLDAGISFTFAFPVDREIVERGIHLISEQSMADSLCPVSDSMDHGMMESVMMDSVKMNHLMDRHATRGRFSWSPDNKQCNFIPDSMMMSNMRYMIHMGREMVSTMEDGMGTMEGMRGHGAGMMSGQMMYHFQTMDTTSIGNDHADHH